MTRLLALLLLVAATLPAAAQTRGGTSEWALSPMVVGPRDYVFEGGASVRNDGGVGIGLSFARNLNDFFALGVEVTYSQFEYRSSVTPAAGNASPGFDSDGTMESLALRLNATWNLLSTRFTPFVTAGVGVNFLDANLDSAPPANACWIYPWYGQVCGDKAPTNTLTRLGATAGAGLRYDLSETFVRLLVAGEWVDLSTAKNPITILQVRVDFGVKF